MTQGFDRRLRTTGKIRFPRRSGCQSESQSAPDGFHAELPDFTR